MMRMHSFIAVMCKRRGLSLLSVFGGLLLLLQLLVPSVALASSSSTTTKSLPALSSQGVLDLAGVSVVRLEISYPDAKTHSSIDCTVLGTVIASWPATSPTDQNNWVVTDGSILSSDTGGCVPVDKLSTIRILASSEFTNQMPMFTLLAQLTCLNSGCSDQPSGSTRPIAETLSRSVNGGVLLSFHTNGTLMLPYLAVATSTSASPTGIELANHAGNWPMTPKQSTPASVLTPIPTVNLQDYLQPTVNIQAPSSTSTGGSTPPVNEPGMPFVDSNGQITAMQLPGVGNLLQLADIQSLEQQQSELNSAILPAHLTQNTLNKQWDTGILQYEQGQSNHGQLTDAVQTLTSIENVNPSFQAPKAFVQMANALLHPGNASTPTTTTTPGTGQSSSGFLGMPNWLLLLVGLIAGVIVLILLFVLVSLVFGRKRAAQKQNREEMERFKAEEVEAHRIADREARRIAEMGSQRQFVQPAGAAPQQLSPVSDLRCPNCREPIEETDTYCPNCRYLLAPSASGLHRMATPPPPAAPQAQPQPQVASVAPVPPQSISEYPTVEISPKNGSQALEKTAPYNVQQVQGRNLSLAVGYESDPGIKRKHKPNEDSLFAIQGARTHNSQPQQFGLFVVADGMGGHANGQDASRLAIQKMIDFMLPRISTTTVTDDDAYLKLLEEGVQCANQAVHERNMAERADMGTTMTSALVIGATAYVANVGDSRTYLYREPEGLTKITHDHSVVASLVDAGIIKPDDIYTHPKRNQIYRSLGEKAVVEVDSFKVPLQMGDKLLLCSDGLWDMVRDPEIQRVISAPAPNPTETGKELIGAALKGGGEDNVSVIVVSITEASGHTGMTGIQLLAKPDSVTVPDLPPM